MRVICLCLAFCFFSCNFFEKQETILGVHSLENGKKIEIVLVMLGATTVDVVQVRVKNSDSANKKDEILKVYENYHVLNSSTIIEDTLRVCLSTDTGYYKLGPDTFYIDISKIDHRIQ